MAKDLLKIHKSLLNAYGPQGWWPLHSHDGSNPTKTGACRGYHPGDYSFPHTNSERFEICLGAILTQNTNWQNVEKAIVNLSKLKALDAKRLLKLDEAKLKEAIRPAGYYNQKAKKLRIFAEFYLTIKGRTPARDQLLDLWGVGPETADSILLYAYKVPVFVIDAYTKRLLKSLGLADDDSKYDEMQALFHDRLPKDQELFNEYHALIVEHAKRTATGNALNLNKNF
jgi:endonuclease III related protein